MKKRGKVLRDTSVGSGLLMVEGQQYPFTLEGMWQSEQAPRTNMAVEVTFGDKEIVSIVPVPDAQLAREQADIALEAAKARGAQLANGLVARFGVPTLASIAALAVGWLVLNTVSINVGSGLRTGLTFWKLLEVLNAPSNLIQGLGSSSGSTGGYGLVAVIALLAPLAPHWWKDSRAHLGGLLPLAFMLCVALIAYNAVSSGMSDAQQTANAFGGPAGAKIIDEMRSAMVQQAMRAVSLGLGFYLSLTASLYLAARAMIKYLASRAS